MSPETPRWPPLDENGDECSLYLFLGMLMFTIHWKKPFIPWESTGFSIQPTGGRLQKTRHAPVDSAPMTAMTSGCSIPLMPVSVDSGPLAEGTSHRPQLLLRILQSGDRPPRFDLRHDGVKADVEKEGGGGHTGLPSQAATWCSSPAAGSRRRSAASGTRPSSTCWPPWKLLATKNVSGELTTRCRRVRQRPIPKKDFHLDQEGVPGNRVVSSEQPPSGGSRAPARRVQIIEHFVQSLGQSMDLPLGEESWEEARSSPAPPFEASQLPRFRFRQPVFARE